MTIIAAAFAVYFNFKASKREDATERRGYDSGVVADLKSLLQEYRTRLDGMVIERDAATLKIVGLETKIVSLDAEIVLLERRIKDMRLEVLELNQDIIQAARAKNAKPG